MPHHPWTEIPVRGEYTTPNAHENTAIHDVVRYPSPRNSSQNFHHVKYISPAVSTGVVDVEECRDDQMEQQPLNHATKGSEAHGWILEIAGFFVMLAALITLVVVLKKVDNQPLSTWSFPFSVNTVVSSLSIVIKAPLAFAIGSCLGQAKWSWFTKRSGPLSGFVAFDDASRGPLGSAALLWWLKSKHWVSLGAWVTLLLLAIDPFWQAVIRYDGRLTSIEVNTASIPTAQKVDVGYWILILHMPVGNNITVINANLYPDVGILANFLTASINSSSMSVTRPPGISCRTGNCTWPLYTTVGICNTCFDISEHVVTDRPESFPDESVSSSCHDASFAELVNHTRHVLPYTGTRRIVFENYDGFVSEAPCTFRSRVALSAAFQPSNTYKFKESQTLLVSFAVLELSADYWNNSTAFQKARPKATECALEFCASAYEVQVRNGEFLQSTITKSTTKTEGSYAPDDYYSPEARHNITRDLKNSLSLYQAFDLPRGTEFGYSVVIQEDLQIELPEIIELRNAKRTFNITQQSIETMASNLSENSTLERLGDGMSNTTNVAQTFDDIARLLTYRIQEVDGAQALGSAEQWATFVKVRWHFTIFPIVVWALGWIFVVGAVADSTRLGLRPMKGDTMATLLWGLDGATRQALRDEKRNTGCVSAGTKVRLSAQASGLELRAA